MNDKDRSRFALNQMLQTVFAIIDALPISPQISFQAFQEFSQ